MANMMDYLTWRGDLTLKASPWCLVDSLVMASMSYNPFLDTVSDAEECPCASACRCCIWTK